MRGSAAFQVTLRRFSIWRGAVTLLALGVVVVLTAWATHPGTVKNLATAGVVVAWSAAAVWWACQLCRVVPVTLAWDGGDWHLRPPGSTPGEADSGRLEVHLDFGSWMLLRFVPEVPSHGSRSRWLPVQRDACAHDWHALRCALYSARSAPSDRAAQDGRPAP